MNVSYVKCARNYWPESTRSPHDTRVSFHSRGAEVRGNRGHQLVPVHSALASDDVDSRQPGAFHDVVANSRGLDAGHLAHVADQLARDAELVVAVFIEESQYARLQRLHYAAAAAAHVRQAAHRLRADAMPRFVALRRG